jgi:hypothetical protein
VDNSVIVQPLQTLGTSGDAGARLMANNFDVGVLRPWREEGRGNFMAVNGSVVPIYNDATLRYDEWKLIDQRVTAASRLPLRAWSDLLAASSIVIPNGMGVSTITHQTGSDPGEASVSLDGLTGDSSDRQLFDLTSTPLPIISSGFQYTLRELETGRKLGTPLDVTRAEQAGRRVAEKLERLTLGLDAWTGFGAPLYGYTSYPSRLTATVTTPDGTNNATVLAEFLDMRQDLIDAKKTGPFRIYVGPSWDKWLDNDFKANSALTLRQRLLQVQGFTSISTLFDLPAYSVVMVQLDSGTADAITGMPLMTIQWDSSGGLVRNFKVMTIAVPRMKKDYNGSCGILHATV